MSDLECAFSGICVRSPELKTSKSGKPFAIFSVVVGEGEAKKFVRVCAFGGTAERVAEQLTVGGKVYAEGNLDASIWQPPDGEARVNLNVAARRVEVLGQIGKNRQPVKRTSAADNRQPDRPRSNGAGDWQRPFDDELPY